MLVFAVVVAVLSGWIVAGLVVSVLFGHLARFAESDARAAAERETLMRHLFAATSQGATANLAALERASKLDPNVGVRDMLMAQTRYATADEHGHIPVGME